MYIYGFCRVWNYWIPNFPIHWLDCCYLFHHNIFLWKFIVADTMCNCFGPFEFFRQNTHMSWWNENKSFIELKALAKLWLYIYDERILYTLYIFPRNFNYSLDHITPWKGAVWYHFHLAKLVLLWRGTDFTDCCHFKENQCRFCKKWQFFCRYGYF